MLLFKGLFDREKKIKNTLTKLFDKKCLNLKKHYKK